MIWHADDLLDRYRRRDLDAVAAASVDAHVLACDSCRAELRRLDGTDPLRDGVLDGLWLEIADEIDRPPLSSPERVLRAIGMPEHIGRLLAATHSLALAAAVALVVSLGFGLLAADSARPQQVALFVTLAAVVPAVGVAAAFGPAVDPTYEIGAAAPLSGLRLVCIRTVAVLAASVVVGLVGSLGLLDHGVVVVGWLLPGLGLALATLALGTWVQPWAAAAAVVGTWLAGVGLFGWLDHDWLAPFGATTQLGAALLAICAGAVLAIRSPHLDHREV
jgi:hypothetical protein